MSAVWLLIGLALGVAVALLALRGRARIERRAQTVDALVEPIHAQLRRVDEQLAALDRDRAHQRGALDEQIRQLVASQERLRGETGSLVAALRQPQARGRWGELQLRRVVELAGMVEHCDFTEQTSVDSGDGILRPDLLVHLPGSKLVVVDAKTPLHAFLEAHEARDETTRTRELAEHARLVRAHVKRLSNKAYWAQFPTAPDFVFLFLPGEHFHSAALEADPALLEESARQNVLIATPTTLIALLRAVAYGWQQETVADSARAVAELGRELHGRLGTFAAHLDRVGARLRGAVGAYNEAVGSFDARVLPSARRFEDYGVVSSERGELPPLSPIDLMAREPGGRPDAGGSLGGEPAGREPLSAARGSATGAPAEREPLNAAREPGAAREPLPAEPTDLSESEPPSRELAARELLSAELPDLSESEPPSRELAARDLRDAGRERPLPQPLPFEARDA